MKIKKLLYLIVPVLFLLVLCGCNSKNTSGTIDCYTITATYSSSSSSDYRNIKYNYSTTYSYVYEYVDEAGNKLYSSSYYTKGVKVFKTRYNNEFTLYEFSKFIGFLTVENNYYLDLDKMIIDQEVKYSKYLYDTNPKNNQSVEIEADNNMAFECAQKGYYEFNYYDKNTGVVYLDKTESTLSRHSYVKLGADATVTYTPKWF